MRAGIVISLMLLVAVFPTFAGAQDFEFSLPIFYCRSPEPQVNTGQAIFCGDLPQSIRNLRGKLTHATR